MCSSLFYSNKCRINWQEFFLFTLYYIRIWENNSRPVVGDNVSLGASVTVIGGVHIGINVTIGAGSVVVKDIPDNCIAAGNPCRVIRFISNNA